MSEPRKTILLADDVAGFVEVEKTFFANEEVDILTASSGDEALNIIRERHPDLVFIDESMPGLKGHEVCEAVKSDPDTESTAVVIVTASADSVVVDACMKAGCDDYLVKPVTRGALLTASEKLLNTRQRRPMRMLVKVSHADLELGAAPDYFFGYTMDVSDRGMLLEVGEELRKDQLLELQFFLPGSSEKVCARGVVVRDPEEARREGEVSVGVKFVGITEPAQRKLRQYVNRIGAMRFTME